MADGALSQELHSLARLYGVQTSYYDVYLRRRRHASARALFAMLRSLGAPVEARADVPSALRLKRQSDWQRPMEPVIVAWGNRRAAIELRIPQSSAETPVNFSLKTETGETLEGSWTASDGAIVRTEEVEGTKYVSRWLPLHHDLPHGYHRLTVELPGQVLESLIICAPRKAYLPSRQETRMWGVFLPLYALRTGSDWGGGDYSGLEKMMDWVGDLGGNVVGTLPLLASLGYGDGDYSPYVPSSRLFWNEFYIDVDKVPELAECPRAQAIVSSAGFQKAVAAQRGGALVNYSSQFALKRRVLEELAGHLFRHGSSRLDEVWHFIESNAAVEDYAGFCAAHDKQGRAWRWWPKAMAAGSLKEGDYEEDNWRYHVYVQWLADQQMQSASDAARRNGLRLYLDLPVGAHPHGYDVWRHRQSFTSGVSVGAPPDTVFTGGQNWGFPPLQPQRVRALGYEYVRAYLRHHLKTAGILRIDHVMGFHRLFCIPEGMPSSQGVYLKYPAEEFYAILALESQRRKTMIVGEDLGNVPRSVRPAMKKHGLNRMYVLRYELADDLRQGLRPVARNSVASLNTHDMPPFAAFWRGMDIDYRSRLGLVDESHARAERDNLPAVRKALCDFLRAEGWLQQPGEDVADVLKACLSWLAAGSASVVLVNLEDLWLETQPQNVPSTSTEYPNWRHKMRRTFEEFCQSQEVVDILKNIAELRRPLPARRKKN